MCIKRVWVVQWAIRHLRAQKADTEESMCTERAIASLPSLSCFLILCFVALFSCSLTDSSHAKYVLAIILKINQCKMDRFYGSWKFVSCDNFDDYLKGETNKTSLLTDLFDCWWWSQGWWWSIIDCDDLECDFDCDG